MDKAYTPKDEEKIYKSWVDAGIFTPKVPKDPIKARAKKEPFTIILPPPNANNPLHAGHALFIVEDIMVRFHRMLGDPTLWLPGTDHAGIETQFVFEKQLQKEGKSRFDFDRDTLFKMIFDYVTKNRDVAKNQMKRLGFSLDWTREKFTLDEDHIKRIYAVFRRMVDEDLVYRDEKIVNYCTFCGTAFSNLEVIHKTVDSHLWYLKYPVVGEKDRFVTVATTRPETMLGDTAVAVNPKDPKYQDLKNKKLLLPLADREIPIIFDDSIDMEFGTGAVKVTPSHSAEDYDLAKKHDLPFIRIFDYNGKSNEQVPQKYQNLYPNQVRQSVVDDMQSIELLEKTEDYSHEVGHCYRCGRPIEPMTAPQWFVKIKPLSDEASKAVQKDEIVFVPKRFKKSFLTWMKDIKDWPISRQIVWGHRIPVWYDLAQNLQAKITFINKKGEVITNIWSKLSSNIETGFYSFEEIKQGLQVLLVPINKNDQGEVAGVYYSETEANQHGKYILQETDTFDTWFSSGQWPYSTLGWEPDSNHSPDFLYFYPTSVLDTMWDILFFWVARMVIFGLYVTKEVPFKVAHMHSRVTDSKGQKMSKSKGNVIDPVTIVDQHGADALRMALVFGIAPGSDVAISDDKIRAQRNFVNKIWNASRFIDMLIDRLKEKNPAIDISLPFIKGRDGEAERGLVDQEILTQLNKIIQSTTKNINKYHFGQASEDLYHFFWNQFCDIYIEKAKDRGEDVVPVLLTVLLNSLKLLHPFMPFVTENIFQYFKQKYPNFSSEEFLAISSWPKPYEV
ncbi:MAG: valine--tRNA ligase [Candidatus Shapirobacteria bacterium]|nr:valine--tRNA ligase [Candidatus Shapirobacteria bacterium]